MGTARFGLILLAAGEGSRMGRPKQLLDFGGRPLVRLVEVRAALEGSDVEYVENQRWPEGMGTSIQTGIRALVKHDVKGAILALADQPLITAGIFNRLVAMHEDTGQPIVTSEYAGTVGVRSYSRATTFRT